MEMKKTGDKRKTIIFNNLRVKLIIILLCIGIIPSFYLHGALVSDVTLRAIDIKVAEVQNKMSITANHLDSYKYLQGEKSEIIDAEIEYLSIILEGRIFVINEGYKIIKDTYETREGDYIVSNNVINCFNGRSTIEYDKDKSYVEVATPIIDYTNKDGENRITGVILFGFSTESSESMMKYIDDQFMIFIILLAVIMVLIAIFLSNDIIRPFYKIKQILKSKGEDELIVLERRHSYKELDVLIDEFNRILEKHNVINESRQEFVSNVSHELKTPLTSIKVLAQSLTSQEDVPNEIYKEFMEDISKEVERENEIINDLLELVKLDKKEAALDIQIVNMNELIEEVLERLHSIADKLKVELIFESIREVKAELDAGKITLVINNIVENAIKYNNEDGMVRVVLDADHEYVVVSVEDNGIGIPEDAIVHIYERFYRVDKSHSKDIDGTGLGLSLTKHIIQLHKGSIEVESIQGEGAKFIVRIPLKYNEQLVREI